MDLKLKTLEYDSGLTILPDNYQLLDDGKTIYMKFENIEPDFNIYIKEKKYFYEPTSFYNDDMDWRNLPDDDDNIFIELPKEEIYAI